VAQWWQPQPEPHTPPDRGAPDVAADDELTAAPPVLANTESSRIESTCPAEHSAGALDSLIGRRRSNVSSQVRQRYS
jgi:hypothetical protein